MLVLNYYREFDIETLEEFIRNTIEHYEIHWGTNRVEEYIMIIENYLTENNVLELNYKVSDARLIRGDWGDTMNLFEMIVAYEEKES